MSVSPPRIFKSSLAPQAYDANALAYIKQNAATIDNVAKLLDVSGDAIAGGIAREITRADGASAFSKLLHERLLLIAHNTKEKTLEQNFLEDLRLLKRDPGALDGNPIIPYLKDAIKRDIGPGTIKVATALQLIARYAGTPQGRALGLDHYDLHDVKAIIKDLSDWKNPLSIKLAGLVVFDGEKFFHQKSVAGIPWVNLSQEQKDAALTAYYTVGEHAVSVDMAKNEFFPFTIGPKGGDVGPWLLFGDNHTNLMKNLDGGISKRLPSNRTLSVAPIKPGKPAAKRSRGSKLRAESDGGGSTGAGRLVPGMIQTLVGQLRSVRAVQERHSPASAALVRYVGKDVAAKKTAPRMVDTVLNARSLAGAIAPSTALMIERAGHGWRLAQATRSARAMYPSSVSGGRTGVSSDGSVANKDGNGRRGNEMLTRLLAAARQGTMPSIAPISGKGSLTGGALHQRPLRDEDNEAESGKPTRAPRQMPQDVAAADDRWLDRRLSDFFDRQSRLPPSGATGFDPRLSPAWPGLKLPA